MRDDRKWTPGRYNCTSCRQIRPNPIFTATRLAKLLRVRTTGCRAVWGVVSPTLCANYERGVRVPVVGWRESGARRGRGNDRVRFVCCDAWGYVLNLEDGSEEEEKQGVSLKMCRPGMEKARTWGPKRCQPPSSPSFGRREFPI